MAKTLVASYGRAMSTEAAVQAALSRSDVREAVRLLELAADTGDSLASFELGRWYLAGQLVPRNLVASRSWFGKAAAAGHESARMIHAALLAVGIGGERNWSAALAELEQASKGSSQAALELDLIGRMAIDDEGNPRSIPVATKESESPDVRWVRSLFTPEECRALVSLATPFLNPSVIVDPASGQLRPDPVRTSDAATFPWVDETPFIHALNSRLAAASGTAVEQGEPLQLLRYSPRQEYRNHSDALPHAENQRILTALVYLNEDFEGGETVFPSAKLALRGKTGDALIFRNTDGQGRPDPRAVHAGLPVKAGTKLLASRWIRERPFGR
jgi:prolyl 4-hydroxylase